MPDKHRTIDQTERILYLRSIPVAAGLPPEVLHVIAGQIRERVFAPGHVLVREGEPHESLHLLISGGVRLLKQGTPIGELKPPQSLGFLGILSRGESGFDAVTEGETRTFELRADAILDVMEDHFEFLQGSLRYVGERLLQELMELPNEALSIPFQNEPMPEARELDIVERIFFLRKIAAFASANVNALAAMSSQVVEKRFAAGEHVWSAGEVTTRSLMIVSGTVACATPDGKKQFKYGPATVAGGIEVLAGKPHWFDLVAETPVLALEANGDQLLDLFEENFAMAIDFLATLSGYLQMILDRRAAAGQSSIGVPREVSELGAVPVGR